MSTILSRRSLLQATALLAMLPLGGGLALAVPPRGFTHSVASGDPQQRSIILWTRYVPTDGGNVTLRVELAEDERFTRIISRGSATCGPATDFCARARPDALAPGRWYYYRFVAPGGELSPVGRTRTLPQGSLDRFRIAVVSCANATSGWFNAYAHAAARDDIDLVVHTGDYIYESPTDRSDAIAALAVLRGIAPLGETVSLTDYRLRYATYRNDPGLMELHRRFPMVVMWDDHEVANNSWMGGARNHGTDEGPWDTRKAAGIRAFREWLPVSDADYERYQIGDLATLFRLETRLVGRSRQLEITAALAGSGGLQQTAAAFRDGPLADPNRTMMGRVQERWLADALAASTAAGTRWQVIAQQVIMAPSRLPPVTAAWYAAGVTPSAREQAELGIAAALGKLGVPTALDRWEGYPAARARLFESVRRAAADLIVLSGDSHNAWASDLMEGGMPVGVEFAGHSVSSLGLEKRFGGDPSLIARDYVAANPGLRWCDTSRRGYMMLDLGRTTATNEWLFLPSRDERSTKLLGSHRMTVARGSRRLGSLDREIGSKAPS
jgi:alkaline phosphatase D